MLKKYLFPYRFKRIGWMLFIPSFLLGLYVLITDAEPSFLDRTVFSLNLGGDTPFSSSEEYSFIKFIQNNLLNEIAAILLIISSLLVAFSKEKMEDELVQKIRLDSLVWATYVNYGILILAFLLFYDLSFLWVMIINMFTLLFYFIIRFNWVLFKHKRSLANEE